MLLIDTDQESALVLGMQSQLMSSLGKLLLRGEVTLNKGNLISVGKRDVGNRPLYTVALPG